MYTLYTFFLMVFTAIFVIVNPVGNVMVFLSLTEDRGFNEKKRIAKKTAIFGCLVLVIFAIFGDFILSFFQINIYHLYLSHNRDSLQNVWANSSRARRDRKHGNHKDDGAYLRCNSSSIHYEGIVGYFLGTTTWCWIKLSYILLKKSCVILFSPLFFYSQPSFSVEVYLSEMFLLLLSPHIIKGGKKNGRKRE